MNGKGWFSGTALSSSLAFDSSSLIHRELHDAGHNVPAPAGDAQSPHVLLQKVVQFFDNQEAGDCGSEFSDQGIGIGVGHSQLEHGRLRPDLPDILVGYGRGNDPQASVPPLYPVGGRAFCYFLQSGQPLLHPLAHGPAPNRYGHEPGRILDQSHLLLRQRSLSLLYQAAGVADSGGGAQNDRGLELLRYLKGQDQKVLGLLAVGGLEQGNLGKSGVIAGILLVLRGVHSRIVGHAGHKAALHPDIAQGHERIRRHIQAHMLHGHNAASPGQGCSCCDLEGHLFIGRPLAVHIWLVPGQALKYLRGGRSGISRSHSHAGLKGPAGYGLIAGHQTSQCHILLRFHRNSGDDCWSFMCKSYSSEFQVAMRIFLL